MNICIGHLTNCATEHFLFCSQIITTYNLQRVFMALVCLPNYVGNKATYMSMLFKQIMEWQATYPLLLPHHPWLQMDKLHFPSCYLTPTELRKDKLHFPSCYDPPPSLWNVKIGSFSHFFLSCTKSCKSAKKIFFSIGGGVPSYLKVTVRTQYPTTPQTQHHSLQCAHFPAYLPSCHHHHHSPHLSHCLPSSPIPLFLPVIIVYHDSFCLYNSFYM